MRLRPEQASLVRHVVAEMAGVGAHASVYVFGSRVNDKARGGDLDLLVETDERMTLIHQARIKLALESRLGLPVDVLNIKRGGPLTPFQRIALGTAVAL